MEDDPDITNDNDIIIAEKQYQRPYHPFLLRTALEKRVSAEREQRQQLDGVI